MQLAGALSIVLALALGVPIGLGAFTFGYARGYSYLLDDPKACVNCHVMRDNYNAWSVSSHRSVTCNGCHTPHDLVGKYYVKAEHGVAHSWAFTFTDPQVIRIKQGSLEVVERNCIECHQATVATTFAGMSGHGEGRCNVCHRGVGHAT
jgi:cytochrome c nitrite reductase small subunit